MKSGSTLPNMHRQRHLKLCWVEIVLRKVCLSLAMFQRERWPHLPAHPPFKKNWVLFSSSVVNKFLFGNINSRLCNSIPVFLSSQFLFDPSQMLAICFSRCLPLLLHLNRGLLPVEWQKQPFKFVGKLKKRLKTGGKMGGKGAKNQSYCAYLIDWIGCERLAKLG